MNCDFHCCWSRLASSPPPATNIQHKCPQQEPACLLHHSHLPLQTCFHPAEPVRQPKTSPHSPLLPSLLPSISLSPPIPAHPSINATVKAENSLLSALFQYECKSPEISSCWAVFMGATAPAFVTWWHQLEAGFILHDKGLSRKPSLSSSEAANVRLWALGCREDAGRGLRHVYMCPSQPISPLTGNLRA